MTQPLTAPILRPAGPVVGSQGGVAPPHSADAIDAAAPPPSGAPCEACAAPVEPLDKYCPACGTPNPNYRGAVAPAPSGAAQTAPKNAPVEAEVINAAIAKRLVCNNCGAQIDIGEGERSVTCPFCDSNYVVEVAPQATGKQPPEFIIGFAITHEDARRFFQEWLKQGSWFHPGDLASQSVADKLKGVYLPFWSFSMLAESEWRAQIGEHWYRTETYTETDSKGNTVTRTRQVQETEWWPLDGQHHKYHWGYLVSGSKGLPQNQALRVTPYNLPSLRRYDPSFLAGWLAEEYSVERDEALNMCREEYDRRERAAVAAFLPGDTHSQLQVRTQFSDVSSDLCLLPIYILSYQYQGKLYRFLLNGQTGKMDGDKPLSSTRIALAVIGGLIVIALIALAVFALNQR